MVCFIIYVNAKKKKKWRNKIIKWDCINRFIKGTKEVNDRP